MRRPLALGMILAMIRTLTPSKVLLVRDRRVASSGPGAAQVRRYRLARLRLDGREPSAAARLPHAKRVYD